MLFIVPPIADGFFMVDARYSSFPRYVLHFDDCTRRPVQDAFGNGIMFFLSDGNGEICRRASESF
jgi:hypothetical protein